MKRFKRFVTITHGALGALLPSLYFKKLTASSLVAKFMFFDCCFGFYGYTYFILSLLNKITHRVVYKIDEDKIVMTKSKWLLTSTRESTLDLN